MKTTFSLAFLSAYVALLVLFAYDWQNMMAVKDYYIPGWGLAFVMSDCSKLTKGQ